MGHPVHNNGNTKYFFTAGSETFKNCKECEDSVRLMCWSHVHRAVVPQLRHLSSISKETGKALLSDIEEIQWSANCSTFKNLINMLEDKYLKSSNNTSEITSAIKHFFTYFRSVWVDSSENNWFEGSNPFGSSNNQGIEGKNRDIKGSHTFRKRMPLGI